VPPEAINAGAVYAAPKVAAGKLVVFTLTETYANRSAALIGLVPPGVVTVTSTVPVPAGEVAVIDVVLLTVNDVALVLPNLTAVAPVKLAPVIVTLVPPAAGPLLGEIEVTAGAVAEYVNWSAALVGLVPPKWVTVTSTVPVPAGEIAAIDVALSTTTERASAPPKRTSAPTLKAVMKLVPVIVTLVPPPAGPLFGEIDVTVGLVKYVNWSAALVALVPPAVVTVTSTVPVPAGTMALIELALLTTADCASALPNLTAVAPMKLVPVIVTAVPADAGFGEIDVTVGAGVPVP